MKRIGITGQNGFVGKHLYNTLGLKPEKYERVIFKKEFFESEESLENFVKQCDVIIHLAAMNRHDSQEVIYQTNIELVKKLILALEKTNSKAQVIFSSSSQENKDNLYGKSKKEGRELLYQWAEKNGGKFTGLIIPNVFGPFGKPNYNSFIATFCHKLTHGENPVIQQDGDISLIYVGELVDEIIKCIDKGISEKERIVSHTSTHKVSEVLAKLEDYKVKYFDAGEIPELKTLFDYQLFNSFRCYFDLKNYYPVKFTQHTDARGAFVEVIRLGIGGQCSFSTTVPGVTRGNHFHTRKIERFAVIKGKAKIQLRKIDEDEVLDFYLDGEEPAYVDMPIWYTHNITNIGTEDLYVVFWINEPFNPEDADTYFVEV
ncbi:polysaccharide biosynthesis C-terminal domain-containing protein [Riemerella anatipestifer]|uniref:polysaccharide biosynthesis C-terminal domain-containing protein n=2 Tax=Riemerella anatipestifer TaxID=34085 RepID=UPI0007EE1B9A|nr:NAD-dependent epimerase/dehydratase family protein [Riemerella anatipestifer]MBT0564419.1 NAD-dependent epimerase/dehydratase family protein [Riemerella anatipestifer]MCE4248737.1 SDR family oxidoreductase [Riemerella anatipestifer]MCO7315782.1 NAD-dependent epimerase/dehydratase family protein [Riemerella anatipestifer]MCO7324049.1 NAD-dependent epimerase/dehydratase family protein [Riemerella anatipestifer]MCQ4062687.1 NAD-dependent epimerase/dehydratase family protein [Riemerella anatipe